MSYMLNSEDLGKVYQYTGIHFNRVRMTKSVRKDHKCLTCNETITKGSSSAYHSGLEYGKFYHFHQCIKCYTEGDVKCLGTIV